MASYQDYYNGTIEKSESLAGFKLVIGGTGLGKTSGIRKLVLNTPAEERQFIYLANRIQLLNEMQDGLLNPVQDELKGKISPDEVIMLPRNSECVSQAIKHPDFDKIFEECGKHTKINQVDLSKRIQSFKQINLMLGELRGKFDTRLLEEQLESIARDVMRYFKSAIRALHNNETDSGKKPNQYKIVLSNPVIQILFPFIKFKHNTNPKPRLLLMTLQKAYLGFFDGLNDISLTRLSGYVIFLDEFDFLESELTHLICESPQIDDPFLFVANFYREMTTHKFPDLNYLIAASSSQKVKALRDNLEDEVIPRIKKLDDTIGYPSIAQFTSTPDLDVKKTAIFKTNRTISQRELYLRKTNRSFDLLNHSDEFAPIPLALNLFNEVGWATAQIIAFFKELEAEDEELYDEVLEQGFPQSLLAIQVRKMAYIPAKFRPQQTRMGNLLEEGFGLYEIQDLQYRSDPREVKFRHYAIHTTPEKTLVSVASKNLVFALSATADIPRLVQNFNLSWVEKTLGTLELPYYQVEKEDEKIVKELNVAKSRKRNNVVEVLRHTPLEIDPLGTSIKDHIDALTQHYAEFLKGSDKQQYRRKRVERFFATLLWLANNRSIEELKTDTHLLFFTTYSQIEYIFSNYLHDKELFLIQKIPNKDSNFAAYTIQIKGTSFIVIFYNAANARDIQSSESVKQYYYELFWQEKPVILVTQYSSAGNGVNLQYYPDRTAKERAEQGIPDQDVDFKNIHLLDAPYYFFDEIDERQMDSQKVATAIKKNIWYWAKLYAANAISQNVFLQGLERVRETFNRDYHSNRNVHVKADLLKNRLARYIQSLGRIERVWCEMSNQYVFMIDEVLLDFDIFVSSDHYQNLRTKRQSIISNNLRTIFEQIPAIVADAQFESEPEAEALLAIREKRSRTYIATLLRKLERVRYGNNEQQDEEAKRHWITLRRLALSHQFTDDLLKDYSATFRTEYEHRGIIHHDREFKVYPYFKKPVSAEEWRLNAVYDVISQNKTIATHFRYRGYELEFASHIDEYFTPYFYQAILVGAIGEEAIRALLRAEGIAVEDIADDEIFELADLKIRDKNWYIDCKNYSEQTMIAFELEPNDPAYHPKLNKHEFMAQARKKFEKLKRFHGVDPDVKLIYINLVGNPDMSLNYVRAEDFNPVPFEKADIVILPGCILREDPNQLHSLFKRFITQCSKS